MLTLLFVSDKCLKEITEFLAYNYPITTQECMLSVNCEKIFSKVSKNSSSTPKSQSIEFFCQLNVISLLLRKNFSSFKISSSTPQKNEFVRVNGILMKIAITEEAVEGEGVIQVEAGKIGEEVTGSEKEEEEKVEVDSINDKGEKIEVKSDKCTASPSKSNKCT